LRQRDGRIDKERDRARQRDTCIDQKTHVQIKRKTEQRKRNTRTDKKRDRTRQRDTRTDKE